MSSNDEIPKAVAIIVNDEIMINDNNECLFFFV